MYKKRADGAGASDTDPEGQPRSGTSETPPARPSTEESSKETSEGKGEQGQSGAEGAGTGSLEQPSPVQIRGEELTGTVKELKQKARDHAMTHFRGQTVIAVAFTERGSVCVKTKDAP
jgi:hypothetical protein